MKGSFIFSTNDKDYRANGEAKKVLSQVKAFRTAGVDLDFLDVINDRKIDKVLYRMPFMGIYPNDFINECKRKAPDYDFVFIRKNIFDCTYIKLLRAFKSANPSIKIIVEIPTYPYFQEWNRIIDKPLIWKEKRVLPRIASEKLVDYYLTLTDDKEIFGIPTIKFSNCIDVDEYSPKKVLQNPDEVHLIGVALLANWHGFDRIIRGLRDYYQDKTNTTKVVFHIVGDGPELNNYKKIVEQCSLEDSVIFEGKHKGKELDYFYDVSNIGIGSLGMYRIGLEKATSLKLREYCAKGIPFIKASDDEVFNDYKYCLNFPNNNDPIDISKIVDWSKSLDYEKAVISMREYAQRNLDWGKYINEILMKVVE